jgi:hypothetical protein
MATRAGAHAGPPHPPQRSSNPARARRSPQAHSDTARPRTPVTLRPRDATINSFIARTDRIITMADSQSDLLDRLQEEVWVIDEMMEELNWRTTQVLQPRTLPHGRLSAEGFRLLAAFTEANDPAVATEFLVHETQPHKTVIPTLTLRHGHGTVSD